MKDSIVVKIFGWVLTVLGIYVLITLWNCYSTDVFITMIRTSGREAPTGSLMFGLILIFLGIMIYNTAKKYSPISVVPLAKKMMIGCSFYFFVFGLLLVNIWHLDISYDAMRNIYNLSPICYVTTAICLIIPGLSLLCLKEKKINYPQ